MEQKRESLSPKSLRENISAFFSAIADCMALSWRTSRFYTVLRLLCCLTPPLLTLAAALLGKYILDLLAGGFTAPSPTAYLLIFAGGLLAVNIIRSLLQKAQLYAQTVHGDIINKELALYMMDKAGKADLEYFDNADYYDKLSSCTRDASVIAHLLWNTISAISAAFSTLISFVVLGRLNVFYGIITLCACVPSSAVAVKYTKAIYSLSLEQINGERQKNYLQHLLLDRRFSQDLRLFDVCERIKEKYQRLWTTLFQQRRSVNRRRSILTGLLECLPELVVTAIGIDIALRVLGGTSTVGDYSLYTGLVSQLWSGVYGLSSAVMQIYDNQLKIKNLKSLEQYQNRVVDTGTTVLKQVETIEFDHVGFAYPGTGKQILRDVSFRVDKHERVALVGLNGSGKSTLIKLLLRLYDVDEGVVKINGMDIRNYTICSLRQSFSVYFQDDPSYSFDLRENVSIADAERMEGDAAITRAIVDSGAGDILDKAPAGLDTFLTRLFDREGMELSGGQYQKLALARTFYRRHSALILDEPSSNLDPRAEYQLFERLRSFAQGKTVLFTSHRLTNVALANRIVVLEHGEILEDGTQQELLAKNGRYAELFRYQQERYQVG